MSFVTNLILFSPLLLIGLLILFVLDRKDSLREGAGLQAPPPPPTQSSASESDHSDHNDQPTDPLLPDDTSSPRVRAETADDVLDPESDFEIIAPGEQDPLEDPFEFDNDQLDGEVDNTGAQAAGPAGQGVIRPVPRIPTTRIVGKKKAASLARRDQRRAYNEFLRSQAEERTRANATLDEEMEEKLFEEKRRRALVEEEIAARKEKERKEKYEREKQEEEKRRKDLLKLKDIVLSRASKGRAWPIADLATKVSRSEKWVIESLKMEGLVGIHPVVDSDSNNTAWELRMLTGDNYYAVLTKTELEGLYSSLDASGARGMNWADMGRTLEELVVK